MKKQAHKKATIKDVAALANVSVASVSRYLNQKTLGHLSDEKAEVIRRAIKLLNYIPNAAARQMVTNKSKMIAVVVANIDDYFSTEVFKGASSILKADGYQGFLLDTGADQLQEKSLLETVTTKFFDGLIFQPLSSNLDLIQSELNDVFPTVILDRDLNTSHWSQVVSNNFDAAKNATQFFQRKGYDHVLILSSDIEVASTRQKRYLGVKQIISKNRIHVIQINEALYSHMAIQNKIENFLKQQKSENNKTLIFCFKERWLLEFIPSLIANGFSMNSNLIQVTGFADTKVSQSILPTSKLISQNPFLMGASAAEILLKRLQGQKQASTDNKMVINADF